MIVALLGAFGFIGNTRPFSFKDYGKRVMEVLIF